jgi:signal transduction histidine kinase/ActR/RegA family two-component response regulator
MRAFRSRSIRPRSIRQKLVTIVMSTTLAALAVSVGSVVGYDLRSYQNTLLNDLTTQAELVGHMTTAALAFDDARLARENLELLRIRPTVRAAALYDEHGALFAYYIAPGAKVALPPRPGKAGHVREGEDLMLFKPVLDNGELIGTVYLRAEDRFAARVRDYLMIGSIVTLLALLTAYGLALRLGHSITTPIDAITNIAREVVARRDYSRRAPRISEDEAAQLVDSFNAMLSEIEQRTLALEGSNREIARLNAGLEQRVGERTAQLELANSELEMAIAEARAANQAKSAFLSSMSHELRTPLNAILGFAQILASDTLPTTPEQKMEFAGHILKSGRHLLTLINEILDLAKVEAGAVTLTMEPVVLVDVLAECRAMIEPLAAARGIRVLFPDTCMQTRARSTVLADRTRLKQVVLNLMSNAVKYNRDGGAVVVDCVDAGPRLRLTVQDTGLGLSNEQLAALFEPFNRLGQESGTQEGSGIGLVVTRRLVELMKGTIGVSSSPGVGSVFWIELAAAGPAAGAPSAQAPATGADYATAAHDALPGASHTLLYIEDNAANLKLVQEIVGFRTDLRLLCAPDGHFGLALARSQRPDVILTDLNLPGMSGYDVLAELQRDPATADIPVVALTANAMPADVARGLAAGFARYLTKPVDIERFNEAIDGVLRPDAARHVTEERTAT